MLAETLHQRRQKLSQIFDFPVILWSGQAPARNFSANRYPFRANSHFLYFAGLPLENAAIYLEGGNLTLFKDDDPPENALWQGETPKRQEIAAEIGAKKDYPLSDLPQWTEAAASLPIQDLTTYQQQCHLLGRTLQPLQERDLALAEAIIKLRLCNDEFAIEQVKTAVKVSIAAHKAGITAAPHCHTEAQIRAVMEAEIIAQNMTCAYPSIVTTRGEILHNEDYSQELQPNDLILADMGAETALGWAADITRTFPVQGRFSATQRALYDVVLAAHDACIAKVSPGVEYSEIHLLAAMVLAEGLVNLGILRGKPEDLVALNAHALFFPHGIGHLLGLDVHDMEDLGDIAGYAEGRKRRTRFGWQFLRLDRPLQPGMIVTIEPGFYQVPGILNNPEFREKYRDCVDWQGLEKFADVRGIRIEDDVLVTETGCEVLTADLPSQAVEKV
ncbi:MAG: aminopeptidase P family protein [Jaaginema sp. PMC 1079.18]|nr:aminopeptidase P family protein [Jaaginema sp. PMC 1079.18]